MNHLFAVEPRHSQLSGVADAIRDLDNGAGSLCLTSPTGSGKTHMIIALTNWGIEQEKRVLIFTNRILLTQQTQRVLESHGVSVGVVSASMPHLEFSDRPVQIANMQTVLSRRRADDNHWEDAGLVIVDEIHQQASGESADLLNEYKARGVPVIGITATPLGVSNVCDRLVTAARTRDLQDEGYLCFAQWFAPSELDTRNIVKGRVDLSITESEARKTWGPLRGDDKIRTRIVGNILGHFERLHPEQTHTLFFAPGVKESLWFAHFCQSRGIRVLHVDGKDFWVDGELHDRKTEESLFQESMEAWRDGCIPIISNRFVLREGVDEPQIKCVVLATPVGSYRSFLQMVGRGLRPHPDKQHLRVIDHGGSWWRHGSVNVNVDWDAVFECSDPDVISKNRIAQMRETGDSPGVGCPACGMIHKHLKGRLLYCQYCQTEFTIQKPSRPIMQSDGKLVEVTGPPVKQWKIKQAPGDDKLWAGLYWNAMKNGKDATFNQLYQQFHYRKAVEAGSHSRPAFWHAYHPPRDLPFMPVHENDWHRNVKDVPRESLNRA